MFFIVIVSATDGIMRIDLITNLGCVNEILHTKLEKTSKIGEHITFVKMPEAKRSKKHFFKRNIIFSH